MIEVFKVNDYTKQGKPKKRAKAVYLSDDKDIEKVASDLKELLYDFETPYFFTSIHAKLKESPCEPVRIVQRVLPMMLVTSPTKLAELLIPERKAQ